MRAAVCIVALLLICATPVFASQARNALVPGVSDPHVIHQGDRADIVVYTDDAYGFNFVLEALDQLGMAYDAYVEDYTGFEAAVASGAYSFIIVNHCNWFALSYAWDDIYFEVESCRAKAIIITFDCDGSNDYSGYMDDLVRYAGHVVCSDVVNPMTIYGWPVPADPDPWCDTPSPIDPIGSGYGDDGDALDGGPDVSFAGWVPQYDYCQVAMNYWSCKIILGCWIPDQYPRDQIVQLWKCMLMFLYLGPSDTDEATWGSVKALFR